MLSKIKNKEQYHEYCERHKSLGILLAHGEEKQQLKDEYYLLDLVIQDYHRSLNSPLLRLEPVSLLKALLKEHSISGLALSKELKISPSVISEILNYKRGFSKSVISKLATKFDLSESVFMKEYPLKKSKGKITF